MKNSILTFVLLLCAQQVFSQIATVVDKETGNPVEFASFYRENPELVKTTNAKGQIDLHSFIDAEKIFIRSFGYKEIETDFTTIESAGLTIELEQTSVMLDHIVVSASRSEQLSRDVPVKIKTISAKEIALQNPQTTADLLGQSGEVFIQKSQQGGGSPMIRGFATNRLVIAVDGVRMNNAIFRSGNLQNIISIDPFSIESAEVMFGPGSVMYGSDAIGGVMSFQTLKPQFSVDGKTLTKGSAAARYASANNEFAGHFDINVGGKKWASLTSVSFNRYGDLKMGSHGTDDYLRTFTVERVDSMDVAKANSDPETQLNSGFTQTGIMQKIRFKPSEKWEFYYNFHMNTTSDYDRYDRLIETSGNTPKSAEWRYGPQIWMMNNLTISNYARGKMYDQLMIRLAHQYFQESRIDRKFNNVRRRTRTEEVHAYSLNADFFKNLGGSKHKLFYGLEGVFNDISSVGVQEDINTGVRSSTSARYPNSMWSTYAAYLSYQYKVNEKFILNAGARYSHFMIQADFDTTNFTLPFTEASLNNGAVNGNLGFVIHPSKKWTIQFNASTGYRAPNIDDLGKIFDSEPGSVIVPNPNLKAEYAYNADLGVAKVFGDWMKIDATGYFTYLTNALVRRDYTLNGQDSIMYDGQLSQVQAIQNAASAYVWGIQAGVEIKLPAGFGISSHINYQYGEEEMDNGTRSRSRHAAPLFGQTRLYYSNSKVRVEAYAVYNGGLSFDELPVEEQGKTFIYAKDENGNPYSPSWYTLNLRMSYDINKTFTVTGGIENITNQRYRSYSSGLAAPGRNFILSLRMKF